jgi:hypothetical protein
MMEELSDVRDGPQINQRSENMLEGREEMRSRVEDRLMVIGKMWKEKRERMA